MNFEKIEQHVADGLITKRKHPTQDLWIYNYSQSCQINKEWNRETIACRGLIVNNYGKIVSRPFKKFFNVSELSYFRNFLHNLYDVKYSEIFHMPFSAYEKLDGSLGISYVDKKERRGIATRGSFESEQAIKATEILNTKYKDVDLDPRLTYLFEIIYKDNRIVVDYGDTEDLYLIAVVDTLTGVEKPLIEFSHLPFPQPELYEGIYGLEELSFKQQENKEGFVLNFGNGFRAKFKFDEYTRLHKIMTGITPKRILEQLRVNTKLEQWLDKVPDEFYKEIEEIALDFRKSFDRIAEGAMTEFVQIIGQIDPDQIGVDRKSFAAIASQSKNRALLFAMLDHKPYDDMIWNMVEDTL
jgi:RNA ligase